ALLRHGPKLEHEQLLLDRFVDIGAELFAVTAACSRAKQFIRENKNPEECAHFLALVDYFCRAARGRIQQKYHGIHHNDDHSGYDCARKIMAGQLDHLTAGIVRPHSDNA
ncbi:MAG TPA: hypothetical protein VNZ25_01475, partial [Candidatus Angelobacter sp.]|nr:hypothetical protein [Candidatus Angelobacter sp.]